MKLIQVFAIIFLFFISCSQTEVFPDKISRGVGQIKTGQLSTENAGLKALLTFVNKYQSRDQSFSLEAFEKDWKIVLNNKKIEISGDNNLKVWASITAFLLELTQKEKYAAELEKIDKVSPVVSELISPFVLTKSVDHIYVNLFSPAEMSYSHTMGGDVTFRQETDYPESGSVRLHFGMTERRHIELYVRIPEWAEGATVTVKQVRYFAAPGTYCKIAKKWKEGDLVEIELPIENYQ